MFIVIVIDMVGGSIGDDLIGWLNDISQIAVASKRFKVWNVGLTASGKPSHQLMVKCKFQVNSEN